MTAVFEYRTVDPKYKPSVKKTSKSIIFDYPGIDPYNSTSYLVTLPPGRFTIECLGSSSLGNGAYTSGTLNVKKSMTIYLFIGSRSQQKDFPQPAFNGGGAGYNSGGGATDIRLVSGEWDDFFSLKSRIMVAAGAGGYDGYSSQGYGGMINGIDAYGSYSGRGATQTSGGKGYKEGKFGKGGSYIYSSSQTDYGAGGGGGYYGGGTGAGSGCCGGGGGSSFISGYEGCNAISAESTEDHIVHSNQTIHYTGISFEDGIMYAGNYSSIPLSHKDSKNYGRIRISSESRINYFRASCKIRRNSFISETCVLMVSLLSWQHC